MRRIMLAGVMVTLMAGTGAAQGIVILQGNDGTSGTVYDSGGMNTYQDSRGTTGTIYDFGGDSTYQFTGPGGKSASGTFYNFEPTPKLGVIPEPLTPAPVLPFSPHVSPLVTPGEPKMPAVLPPSPGTLGTGFWKR